MNIMQWLSSAVEFISEGILELFSSTDDYPAVGLQPYGGEIYAQWMDL